MCLQNGDQNVGIHQNEIVQWDIRIPFLLFVLFIKTLSLHSCKIKMSRLAQLIFFFSLATVGLAQIPKVIPFQVTGSLDS